MRVILLLIALLSSSAHAQEKVPTLSSTFYCFRYAPELQSVYVRTGAQTYMEVELSTANLVGPMNAALVDGVITLHRKDTDSEGKTIYPLVARAKIGAIKHPLIVLVPGKKDGKLSYRSLVLDRSDAKFPLGSYQFVNFSTHPVRAKIGTGGIQIRPGKAKIFKPKGSPGEMMPVIFQYHDGEHWRRMTSTRWANRDDRRSLICAYLDPADKRMKMRSIPERLKEASPPPADL